MHELFQVLAIGGDVGVWVILGVLWRIDKRITWCEYEINRISRKVDEAV